MINRGPGCTAISETALYIRTSSYYKIKVSKNCQQKDCKNFLNFTHRIENLSN